MRCRYCRQLIIHRFNGNYNRRDRKRKYNHERMCKYNPNVREKEIHFAQLKANLLKTYLQEIA